MSDPAPTKAQAMKAVLTDERFSDPDWIYERKLDGVRCIAIRDGDRVRLLSRNDLSMNDRYPEVAEALEAQECRRFAIDGEVVAFDHGQTSFSRLARRGRERVAVFLYAFDITWLDGRGRARPAADRAQAPAARRAVVRRRAAPERPPQARTARSTSRRPAARGGRALIAKRADSRYTSARSKDWLKFKCERGQELVIGGYTPPKGSRKVLGALLVGYFADGELRYAGKVGTGFDQAHAGRPRRAAGAAGAGQTRRSPSA